MNNQDMILGNVWNLPRGVSEVKAKDPGTFLEFNTHMVTFYKQTYGELSQFFLALRELVFKQTLRMRRRTQLGIEFRAEGGTAAKHTAVFHVPGQLSVFSFVAGQLVRGRAQRHQYLRRFHRVLLTAEARSEKLEVRINAKTTICPLLSNS